MESLRAWLVLRAVKGLGSGTLSRLVLRFGSPEAVRKASVRELTAERAVSPSVAQRILGCPEPETLSQIDRELSSLERRKFSILTILDSDYPPRLKMIPDPPPLLYMTGRFQQADHHALAIVGARRGTPGGCAFTRQLSAELAALGFTIVSGLARGIDAAAHQGALKASCRTVAVLGCGIDRTYPPEHMKLREQVEANGAVFSEFPPGTAPQGHLFPQRNRLISGLSLGVVVTEATTQSGSLITARLAVDQNREVFAVPGALTNKMSKGPHRLIKQGAKLVEGPDDVLEELLPQLEGPFREQAESRVAAPLAQPLPLGLDEQALYENISLEPVSLEDLISQDRHSPAEVMSTLLSLEIKGFIRQLPGSHYVRNFIR